MYQEHDVLKEVYDKACEDLGCDEIEGVDFPETGALEIDEVLRRNMRLLESG